MATLTSAFRTAPPAYPPPAPSSLLPDARCAGLRSRFSAETLVIKPSPSQTLKSIFSVSSSSTTTSMHTIGSASPPTSLIASATKRYHRRMSSTQASKAAREEAGGSPRLGHFPSASESHLDLRRADSARDTRPSLDKAEQADSSPRSRSGSRSRSRTRPSLRRRTSSTGASLGALAADKLAGVAKDVMDKFNIRRQHSRQDSELSIRCRSVSSPSPGSGSQESSMEEIPARHRMDAVPSQDASPPRHRTRETTADTTASAASSASATSRSTTPSSSGGRRGRLPELAAARPRPKHLPANPRPVSPPSPSIPPLKPTLPRSSPAVEPSSKPFCAHLVQVPAAEVLRTHGKEGLFVRLAVGGQSSYRTTVATLLQGEDGGGKIGDFVQALLHRSEGNKNELTSIGTSLPANSRGRANSVCSIPSKLDLLPLPHSPFPFSDEVSIYEHDSSFGDPASPIDPLINTAASALIGDNLFLSIPSVFDVPSPTLPSVTAGQSPQHGLLVASPTTPSDFKHKSIHPDLGNSRVSYDKEEQVPALATVLASNSELQAALARRLQVLSPSSVPSSDSSSLSSSSSSSSSEVESLVDIPPNELPVLAHFEVMREQLHLGLGEQDLPSSPESAVHVRQSLTYGRSFEASDLTSRLSSAPSLASRSLNTCAAGQTRLSRNFKPSTPLHETSPITLPAASSHAPTPKQASPPARPIPLAARTIEIFLDRTDFPLPVSHSTSSDCASPQHEPVKAYSALMAFLREGTFPPPIALPGLEEAALPSEPAVEVLSTSAAIIHLLRQNPSAVLSYLGAFEAIRNEARWLGLSAAERACEAHLGTLRRLIGTCENAKEATIAMGTANRDKKVDGRAGWI
ncbi:hypothetical protein JCM10908_004882 [Rhodotorula pacifica]|uniref:uncharacterized protein n=1 Tax=Rhodotorula pacifica TaxID=1495444 RepID=UPI00317A5FEB